MNLRARRPFLWALGVSLALHLVALLWPVDSRPIIAPASPLKVELTVPPAPPPPPKQVIRPTPTSTPQVQALETPVVAEAPMATDAPVAAEAPSEVPVVATPAAPPETPSAAPAPMPSFPSQVELVFDIHAGRQGFSAGRTRHSWRAVNGHYLIVSSSEASGIVALFLPGKYIQTSRGTLTASGLQPESFWVQRGQSGPRTESAEFDWDARRLDYGKPGELRHAELDPGAQDQLSILYQLALSAPHSGRFRVMLTTGRRVYRYEYAVVGDETIETPLGSLRTQHLTRVGTADGDTGADVWLAYDHHFLPVRFTLSRGGQVMEHVLAELRLPASAP